ncbi:MAG TPA: hypothetical protein VMS00_14375 [Acidimicrobiales bacterium]|nr:hypothetical protein [Acidimicrobiales bacterium]
MLRGRDRLESERFVALRSHYGFDSFFCQPGVKGAHEKGGVEGEIGRFRRRHMVPLPRANSMAELNELLLAGAAKDDRRFITGRRIAVGEHFALEAEALRPLPTDAFDYRALGNFRVDRKARVSVRGGALYSVPARYCGRRLDALVGAEVIEVLDGKVVVAWHPRSQKGEENLVLDHYLEVLAIKPGALPGATALARARAAGAFSEEHERFWSQARRRLGDRDGTRALIEVLLLHRTLPAGAVRAGMTAALATGSANPAVVAIEARRSTETAQSPVVPIGQGLSRFDRPKPSVTHYDQLLEGTR